MADTGTLHDAFIGELRDACAAERHLTTSLPRLAQAAPSDEENEELAAAVPANRTCSATATARRR